LIAGTAGPLAVLIFGEPFAAMAPILAWLVTGGFVMLVMTVCLTLMIAFGYPRLLILVTGPLVPLALAGHILAVPRWGAVGAAAVTGCLSVMAAVAAAVLSARVCGLAFPWASLWRALLGAGLAFGYAVLWPAVGLWVFLKLAIGCLLLVMFYWAIGEFSAEEIAVGHNLLHMPVIPHRPPA
jgi:O-antigen/teichoic acid export membrane protein